MRISQKVTFTVFYLEYKQVKVRNTQVSHSHIFSPFLDIVTLSLEALHIGRSENQSIGGKMICPAVTAIA